uniref:Uncharacterized protein n=1 Tax=Glossina palpalis gambiensis TaxID=67801 RepID=A0A1B0BY16_9MUSC
MTASGSNLTKEYTQWSQNQRSHQCRSQHYNDGNYQADRPEKLKHRSTSRCHINEVTWLFMLCLLVLLPLNAFANLCKKLRQAQFLCLV